MNPRSEKGLCSRGRGDAGYEDAIHTIEYKSTKQAIGGKENF